MVARDRASHASASGRRTCRSLPSSRVSSIAQRPCSPQRQQFTTPQWPRALPRPTLRAFAPCWRAGRRYTGVRDCRDGGSTGYMRAAAWPRAGAVHDHHSRPLRVLSDARHGDAAASRHASAPVMRPGRFSRPPLQYRPRPQAQGKGKDHRRDDPGMLAAVLILESSRRRVSDGAIVPWLRRRHGHGPC